MSKDVNQKLKELEFVKKKYYYLLENYSGMTLPSRDAASMPCIQFFFDIYGNNKHIHNLEGLDSAIEHAMDCGLHNNTKKLTWNSQ
jgi:hypothetical protein